MKPVNTRSLFHYLCITLDKIDKGEVDPQTANAISKVVGQANNLLNYELKRAMLMSNDEFAKNHRSLEIKSFDQKSIEEKSND